MSRVIRWKGILVNVILLRSVLWLVCCLSLTVQAVECERRRATAVPEVILTNGEWSPYMTVERDDQGLLSEIVRQAFALRGVHVRYEFMPWNRALEHARTGQCDGTLGWSKVDNREQDFFFSAQPIGVERVSFFHQRDSGFDWQTPSDLIGLRIGITHGYHYGDEFHRFLTEQNIQVIRPYQDVDHLQLLLARRVDVSLIDQIVGVDLLARRYAGLSESPIVFHPAPLQTADLYLLMSRQLPGNEPLIKRFDEGLRELIKSGEYGRIMGYGH